MEWVEIGWRGLKLGEWDCDRVEGVVIGWRDCNSVEGLRYTAAGAFFQKYLLYLG